MREQRGKKEREILLQQCTTNLDDGKQTMHHQDFGFDDAQYVQDQDFGIDTSSL